MTVINHVHGKTMFTEWRDYLKTIFNPFLSKQFVLGNVEVYFQNIGLKLYLGPIPQSSIATGKMRNVAYLHMECRLLYLMTRAWVVDAGGSLVSESRPVPRCNSGVSDPTPPPLIFIQVLLLCATTVSSPVAPR